MLSSCYWTTRDQRRWKGVGFTPYLATPPPPLKNVGCKILEDNPCLFGWYSQGPESRPCVTLQGLFQFVFRKGNTSFYKGMEVIKWKIPKLRRSFKPTSPIYTLQPFGMRGKNSGRWRICLVIATQLFCSRITSEKLQFSKVLQNCWRIFFLKTNDSSPAPEHKQNTQITFLPRVTRWLNSWPKLQRTFATVCGWTSSFSTISCTLLASRDQTGWFFSLSLTPCFRSNIAKLWYAAEAW